MLTKEEIKQKTIELMSKNHIDTVFTNNDYVKYYLTDYGKGFLEAIRMVLNSDEGNDFVNHLYNILGE